MEICIKGSPEEIAALIVALQERYEFLGNNKIYSSGISAEQIKAPVEFVI